MLEDTLTAAGRDKHQRLMQDAAAWRRAHQVTDKSSMPLSRKVQIILTRAMTLLIGR